MTREEAIEILWQYDVNFEPHPAEKVMHAIDMAIESLSADEEKENGTFVNRDNCSFNCNDSNRSLVKVVRCKDCRFWKNEHLCLVMSRYGSIDTKEEHYCSWGERREP